MTIPVVDDSSAESFRGLMLRLRGRTSLTQRQLAARMGVNLRSVQAWEAGDSYPISGSLQLLIAAFVDEHAFAPGHEPEEAEALWAAALHESPRLRPNFERAWFDSLVGSRVAPAQTTSPSAPRAAPQSSVSRRYDWGEAPDGAGLVGRHAELATLKRWVLDEKCHIVAVLGAGGIGKTKLTARLTRDVEEAFELGFWRSVRNAPSATDWLGEAIGVLSDQEQIPPEGEAARLLVLLELLRSRRCLVVLDNLETLLEPGRADGEYRPDVGGYSELLRAIGQVEHQSCLIVTSRESPVELAELENSLGLVRTFELRGVEPSDTRVLLGDQRLRGDPSDWDRLTSLYGGNCLALRVVGQTIRQVFDCDIAEFLVGGESGSGHVYGGIRQLLDAQFNRLSPLERALMRWLAIDRDPVTFGELAADMRGVGPAVLLEVINALRRRSLVERIEPGPRFTLQSVVLEYVTDGIVEIFANEIEQAVPRLLVSHPLLKAQSRDYVRRTQERLIVVPILERLIARYGGPHGAERHLLEIVDQARQDPEQHSGYAPGSLVNLLRVMRGDLRGIDFSKLRIQQAFMQDTAMHDASLAGASVKDSVLADVFSWPVCVALSGDGRVLAVGTSMGEVYLWRVIDRALVARWKAHNGMTLSVALSDSGDLLASCSDDGAATLWEPDTGRLLSTQTGHTGGAQAVALSGDGRLLGSGDATGTVRVWRTDDGERLAEVSAHGEGIWGLSFDVAGSRLSSASGGSVRIWETESRQLREPLEGHHGGNFSVAQSGDGRIVAAGSFDGSVHVWNADTGQLVATLPGHAGGAWSVALTADGTRLVSGSFDGTVRLWDTFEGRVTAAMHGHTGGARTVSVTRDGQTLVSGSTDGTVRLWQADGRLLGELKGFTSSIRAVALSGTGQWCASASFDRTVRLWDMEKKVLLKTFVGHAGALWAVGMSPNGKLIASGGDDCALNLWRTERDEPVAVLPGHTSSVWCIAVSQDESEVITGSLDGTVRVWSVQPPRQVAVLDAGNGPVWGLTRSHDGLLVASAGGAGVITLWDKQTRTARLAFQAHASPIWSLALSGDERTLASAGFDTTTRLWDVQSGACLGVLEGNTGGVWAVAFSGDGRFVATGGFDGIVRLWDAHTFRLVHSMRGHDGGIWSLAFDGAARLLVSGGVDGAMFLWDVTRGVALDTLRRDRMYERLNITGLTGVTEAQWGALLALGAVDQAVPVAGTPGRFDTHQRLEA